MMNLAALWQSDTRPAISEIAGRSRREAWKCYFSSSLQLNLNTALLLLTVCFISQFCGQTSQLFRSGQAFFTLQGGIFPFMIGTHAIEQCQPLSGGPTPRSLCFQHQRRLLIFARYRRRTEKRDRGWFS